jgi:ribosome-associated protein
MKPFGCVTTEIDRREMIEITPQIRIDESELQFDFIRASGPGGQNVNKVSTSVQLRFDVQNSPSLDPIIKDRLIKLAGKRVNQDGILIISARRYRTQEQNRQEAVRQLVRLIADALEEPSTRKPTRPSRASQYRRLERKSLRKIIKQSRRRPPFAEE